MKCFWRRNQSLTIYFLLSTTFQFFSKNNFFSIVRRTAISLTTAIWYILSSIPFQKRNNSILTKITTGLNKSWNIIIKGKMKAMSPANYDLDSIFSDIKKKKHLITTNDVYWVIVNLWINLLKYSWYFTSQWELKTHWFDL